MKNRITLLIILNIGWITVSSCRKYENGPAISVYSKAARLANTWRVDSYKKNGIDYTALVSDYSETYTKTGSYSYKWGMISGSGTCVFQNNNKQIRLTGFYNQRSQTLVILKLDEKQFWYYYKDGNDRKEFHMVQQ
jgi:4-diphosphocytidyl-2C-methyl-D-erythritol kinase